MFMDKSRIKSLKQTDVFFLTLGAPWSGPALTAGPYGPVDHLALHLRWSESNQQGKRNIDYCWHLMLVVTVMHIYAQIRLFLITLKILKLQICQLKTMKVIVKPSSSRVKSDAHWPPLKPQVLQDQLWGHKPCVFWSSWKVIKSLLCYTERHDSFWVVVFFLQLKNRESIYTSWKSFWFRLCSA